MEDGTYEGTAATKTYVDDVIANEKNERVSSDKSFESLVADPPIRSQHFLSLSLR